MSRVVLEDLRLVNNLRDAAKQYTGLKRDRAETAVELYRTFLKNYIFKHKKDIEKIAQNLNRLLSKG